MKKALVFCYLENSFDSENGWGTPVSRTEMLHEKIEIESGFECESYAERRAFNEFRNKMGITHKKGGSVFIKWMD